MIQVPPVFPKTYNIFINHYGFFVKGVGRISFNAYKRNSKQYRDKVKGTIGALIIKVRSLQGNSHFFKGIVIIGDS